MRQLLAYLAGAAIMACLAFTQSTEPKPSFLMADIHPSSDFQAIGSFRRAPWVGGGRYEIRNSSLLDLINQAYGVDSEKIIGGPIWLEWDHYDLTAKLPADSTAETQKIMLQNLLADRFKLAFHNDTKDLPAYTLSAGKSPKLKASDGAGDNGCRGQGLTGPGVTPGPNGGFQINPGAGAIMQSFICHHVTMEEFTQFLIRQVSQNAGTSPVTDQTELKGAWDFEFKTSLNFGPFVSTAADTITIFDAVDKQLGLKLTMTKVPLKVIVVEGAQKPTPNAPGVAESLALTLPKEFDVADVRPTDPNGPGGRGMRIQVTRGGGVNFNFPLRNLILQAYGLNNNMLIVPPNMEEALQNRYTIVAKPPAWGGPVSASGPAEGPGQPPASPDDSDAAWLMMRGLLADRFKLVMHKEERQLTAWKLVAVKPKMKKADPTERMKTDEAPGADGKDPRKEMPIRSRLAMFQNVTMAQFADKLQGISAYLQTPVRDATGIDGAYDFTINFSPVGAGQVGGGRGGNPEGNGNAPMEAAEPNGAITLFEAIEQQLWLKLVEEKRPVPVWVIDHVESKPTDN
jgi:uncharacterized protein (TIGR03435 family)